MKILVTSANTESTLSNVCKEQIGDFEVDFICYNKTKIINNRKNSLHPRLLGKIPKMLAWEHNTNYDYYIWIDSIFNFNNEYAVQWFLDKISDKDAAFFSHPHRNTVKSELDFCIENMKNGNEYLLGRYDGERMEEQVTSYFNNGFNDNVLIAAGAFIYSKNLILNKSYNMMKEWFYHNCIFSVQDQLSLPYLLQMFDVKYKLINENIFACEYLK